jgi:uncharacterized membrane protein YccC
MSTLALIKILGPIPGALLRELRAITLRGPRARDAIRAMLSVFLAVTLATVLQLDDLVWAAFSGFMVMRGSVKQTIPRGLHRVVGTVAGATLGMALAPLAAESPLMLMVSLFAVSWIGVFGALESDSSYAWVFVGITAGLVLTDAFSSPSTLWHFTVTRVLEILVGTGSSFFVACLFERSDTFTDNGAAPRQTKHVSRRTGRDVWREQWLRENWPLIVHATRSALAVAALPLIWRWFDIQSFSQTAVTSYVLMIIPAATARGSPERPIYERAAHRMLGCLLGSSMAIVCAGMLDDSLVGMALAVGAAVWIGDHIQSGAEGINYLGTQFTLGFLITLIQKSEPITSVLPGIERLLGIVIGCALICFMFVIWPPAHGE